MTAAILLAWAALFLQAQTAGSTVSALPKICIDYVKGTITK